MIDWMIYAVLVAATLSAAAMAAERAARVRRRATRWIWLAALAGSLMLPVLIASVTIRLPGMLQSGAQPAPIALRDVTSIPVPAMLVDWGGTHPYGTPDHVEAWIRDGWMTLSLLMMLALVASSVVLRRRKRGWVEATLCGEPVLVAPDTGPAAAGLLRPCIVVPAWLLQAPESHQHAVMAHEGSHLQAGDPRLIALAALMLVSMPWNPLLWWQFRRLRRAIEVDCDARVLSRGGDIGEYCETLIHVGQSQSSRVGLVPAMSEPGSFLEQRIRLMLAQPRKWAGVSALALVSVSVGMAAFATQMTPPGNTAPGTPKTITLTPAVLDRYVGFYKVSRLSRVRVTRQGDGLRIVITAQRPTPRPQYALPLGADRFAVQGSDAVVHFTMDTRGYAKRLDVVWKGHVVLEAPHIDKAEAARIDATLAARIKAQKPLPDSQKALKLLLSDPISGAGMSDGLARARAQQRASREKYLARLGPVRSYTFTGVSKFGDDVYTVRHAYGTETVELYVDHNGVLTWAYRYP